MNKAMLPTKQEAKRLEEEKQLYAQVKALHKQLKELSDENNKASSSNASESGFFAATQLTAPTDNPVTEQSIFTDLYTGLSPQP